MRGPSAGARNARRRRARIALLSLLTAACIAGPLALLRWTASEPPAEPAAMTSPPLAALALLAGRAQDFPDPGEGPPRLPRDHGPQLDQFGEYWLFAGRLDDESGGRHGFQLVVVRAALQAEAPDRASRWAARDLYAARLVIIPDGSEARIREHSSRAALGLAGAQTQPPRVGIRDWEIRYDPAAGEFLLAAGDEQQALGLRLRPASEAQPFAAPGTLGYWLARLEVDGELALNGRILEVAGSAMMDRAWGRSLPAGGGQLALIRLWVQLEDGAALRCQQLRRRAGGGIPLGECLLQAPDGSVEMLDGERIQLEPTESGWRRLGGVRYPLQWRVSAPEHGVDLLVAPPASRTGTDSFTGEPWSGVVDVVEGGGGWGLLELSNYAGGMPLTQEQEATAP